MPKCIIDGKELEFRPGQTLIQIAQEAGIHIPFFCYHPGLSVVAQCRMCAVEVEKNPKLQTACSTPAMEGMIVHTRSQKTLENQASVMEFLLINHPLDCPICDKSGECDLQDYSFEHGSASSRYEEERRSFETTDMGPVIKKNMNRCIHCTRCIRFGEEIAGIREMVALHRGNHTEITTLTGKPLETEYAGNYADICPTGSLTLKDFRFKKRVWYLKKTPSICGGCSKGCNLELHHENEVIYRCLPRKNLEINHYWLCDEGRFHFKIFLSPERYIEPFLNQQKTDWSEVLSVLKKSVSSKTKGLFLIGSDLSQEEVEAIEQFRSKVFPNFSSFHFGTPNVISSQEDGPADPILKRKSRTPNLHGLEKLGIRPFNESHVSSETDYIFIFRGGRAIIPELPSRNPKIGMGVFFSSELEHTPYLAILPGTGFPEKNGTIYNYQMKPQKWTQAIRAPGNCKPIPEILMHWMHQSLDASMEFSHA